MERDVLRLECLKLAVGKTPNHADAIKRAEEFYAFVKAQDFSSKPEVKTEKLAANVKP